MNWINVKATKQISISKSLRDKYIPWGRLHLFYDSEENLIGIEPSSATGYKLSDAKFTCRQIPDSIPRGRFLAWWDEAQGMIIADLRQPITKQ